jgi:hypothetical protein
MVLTAVLVQQGPVGAVWQWRWQMEIHNPENACAMPTCLVQGRQKALPDSDHSPACLTLTVTPSCALHLSWYIHIQHCIQVSELLCAVLLLPYVPQLLKCLAGCSLRIESIITPPAEWDIYTAPPPSAPAQAHAPGAAAGAPDGGAGTAFGSGTPYLPAGAVPAGTVVVPGTEAVHVHAAGGVGASGGAGKGSGAASGAQGRGRPSTPFPPHLLPVLQSHLARTKERAIDKVSFFI